MEKRRHKNPGDFLEEFSLKPAPQALKGKLLDGVLQQQESDQGLTVFLRNGFMGCLLILIFILTIDAVISDAQNRRISSLLDNRQESTDKSEEEWSMLKEIIGKPIDSHKNAIGKILSGLSEKPGTRRHLPEWRESIEKEFE